MTRREALSPTAIKDEAEYEARKMRDANSLGYRDMGDIFRFMEQALGYLLVRYPLGEEALEGFAALYQGEHLIVTNSSKILSRERFTAAHEIGHHIFDFANGASRMKADQETGCFNEADQAEYRADCFAVALLMPQEGIDRVLHEAGLKGQVLTHMDVVRLQLEFGVSYRAMVRRLVELGYVDPAQAKYLFEYRTETGENLHRLFRRAQAPSETLLEPWGQVWVPTRYLRCLEANYEEGLISYPVLQKILGVVGTSPEKWGFEPVIPEIGQDEIDIDALIGELADEV